jgi:hypothetical protein
VEVTEMVSEMMRRLSFRLKWLFMSERERYAYFWSRTRANW